ncbi:class I SAM-dependent methyltransferase [Actinoplanes sp. CA-131856]
MGSGSGLGFQGDVVDYYQRFRRGYPPAVVDALAAAVKLDNSGLVLDLGCGTGQLTLPIASRTRAVVGMDPEPEMLARARQLSRARNVTWILGADVDVPAVGAMLGRTGAASDESRGAVHRSGPPHPPGRLGSGGDQRKPGMVARRRVVPGSARLPGELARRVRRLRLRHGRGQSAALREAFDRGRPARIENQFHYVDTIDFEHLIGGLYSAFSIDQLPAPDERADFEVRLRAALPETFEEPVAVSMLIGTKN